MNYETAPVIIFFDGVCHLCNGFVDFILKNDQQKKFKFAPLQGSTALSQLEPHYREKLSSVIVKTPTQVLEKSDAILFVLNSLGGVYSFVTIFRIVPKSLRDLIYDWIAKNRYSWFGERDSCRLPLPSEKDQLLP